MLIVSKRKYSVQTLITVLVFFASKSTCDKSLEVTTGGVRRNSGPFLATIRGQEVISDEKDNTISNSEKNADDLKPEKDDEVKTPDEKEENQYEKSEENDQSQVDDAESTLSNEKAEEAKQNPSATQEEKAESKLEGTAESKLEEKTESKLEEKAETKLQEKAKSKLQEKAESKLEENADSKLEDKAENKLEDKAEDKLEEKADSKLQEKAENKLEERPLINRGELNEPQENKAEEINLQENKAEESKSEDNKSEESKVDQDKAVVADSAEETKKQNIKLNRKIASDLGSIKYDGSHNKQAKRETRTTEFLGLPRDASYFFDDLEPFINNNSARDNFQENGRVARAIPTRDSKVQKSKVAPKKDVEEETGEEEEDDNERVEEKDKDQKEEKDEKEDKEQSSEGDYDDDEDSEPDCQIVTRNEECTTSPECTTSSECPPTTTECTTKPTCTTKCTKSTSKCTTKSKCTTPCPTTPEDTRCPKICAKGVDKGIHNPLTEKAKSWDMEGKKLKKKVHGKNKHDNSIEKGFLPMHIINLNLTITLNSQSTNCKGKKLGYGKKKTEEKANRKFIGFHPTTLKAAEWDDIETKDPSHSTIKSKAHHGGVHGKRKIHAKENLVKQIE